MENLPNCGIQLELKYCERCGGLWLRPKSSDLIFCARCAKAMAGIMPIWPTGIVKHAQLSLDTPAIDDTFWGEGGNA